jgi:hypothetical protein
MGMLSRGAELQVPDLCRPVDGTGMGSIYGRRSDADMEFMLIGFTGL